MSTEPVARRGTILQKPSLVMVCVRIWDRVRATSMNVSRKRHARRYGGRTSIQRSFLGCSGGRVAHTPYCEEELVLVRALLAEGSARSLFESLMTK